MKQIEWCLTLQSSYNPHYETLCTFCTTHTTRPWQWTLQNTASLHHWETRKEGNRAFVEYFTWVGLTCLHRCMSKMWAAWSGKQVEFWKSKEHRGETEDTTSGRRGTFHNPFCRIGFSCKASHLHARLHWFAIIFLYVHHHPTQSRDTLLKNMGRKKTSVYLGISLEMVVAHQWQRGKVKNLIKFEPNKYLEYSAIHIPL